MLYIGFVYFVYGMGMCVSVVYGVLVCVCCVWGRDMCMCLLCLGYVYVYFVYGGV